MKKILILSIVAVTLILDSCVPSKPVKEEKVFPPGRLIKKLEGNRRKVKTFRGTGIIDVETENFGANANFEVLLKKPDSIKISIYGPFGIDVAHGMVTKNDFLFYDVMKNELHKGKDSNGILRRLFKVDLTFNDLMDALAGAVNLTDKLRREPDGYRRYEDKFVLTYYESGRKLKTTYEVVTENLAIHNYKLSKITGETVFEGKYSDFRLFDGVPIPYKTRVINGAEDQRLSIEYRTIDVNSSIEKISLRLPKDVKIIQW